MEWHSKILENNKQIEYLSTPFKVKEGIVIECFKRIDGGDYELADTTSGEVNVFRKAAKNKRVIVDKGNYVKVFKGNNEVIRKLSVRGKEFMFYLMLYIGIHSDVIVLDCGVVCEWCGWKKSTYYTALDELLEKNIIARKKGSSIEFFVNINYVFNGSRLKLKNS